MQTNNIIIGVVMLLVIVLPLAYLTISQNKKNKQS
jgi:hypothetical protein